MDFSVFSTPPKHPLHTLHSCKFPQQLSLHVDTSLEAIFFFLVLFIFGGMVPSNKLKRCHEVFSSHKANETQCIVNVFGKYLYFCKVFQSFGKKQ